MPPEVNAPAIAQDRATSAGTQTARAIRDRMEGFTRPDWQRLSPETRPGGETFVVCKQTFVSSGHVPMVR
ncbi:hypothetical protein GCM10010439_05430 [Actinocorallia aurantiaca]|uniref:Uncharacterized protein n=1 Tax=Actinocorallia aurantiaca TaxID=46204 RepID=A0ABN3TVU5_9ACTN